MLPPSKEWNPIQSRLKEIILKKEHFDEAIRLTSVLHSIVHSSNIYHLGKESYMDELWTVMNERAFREMPTVKDVTAAWNIWHITRIEDIVAGLLIADDRQVLNDEWLERLNAKVKDTANAMSDEEIIEFSRELSVEGLRVYRDAVGERTKQILENLNSDDMKRKMKKEQLSRILSEGGVTPNPDSVWLLNFWGRKNVAGLIQMPITRHQIVHLNDCAKLISRSQKNK